MKAHKNPFFRSLASTTMIVAFGFVPDKLSAANLWDAGGGANTNWTTAANWDDNNTATSGSGNDVAFGAGTTSLNDYAGYVAWRSIIFNSGLDTFTLNSSAGANWDLYFKIENLSANKATINIDNISLKGIGNEFDPTAGDLAINTQNVFTNGNNLNVYGTKVLTISNSGGNGITGTGGLTLNSLFTGTTILTGSNNYTGTTTINGGKLQINSGGSTASGSAIAVNSTTAGALTINSGGTVGGNVTVAPSATNTTANLVNNGAISGTLTINSSTIPAPITVQANAVISGNANLGSGSSTGNILNNGQLTISGSVAATTGTISSTGTGSGASAGTGAIYLTNSGGSSLNFANGSSFAWLAIGNGATGSLNSSGTVSLYAYSQNSSLSAASPYTININSGTWNVGQVGQNNSGKVATGTTNILGGSIFNLGAMSTWSGLGTSQGGAFMHGIWNIGGASSGTMNITGGFSEGGGFSTSVPTGAAINGLQFTVGNGGTLTTTTASTLGFATVQVAGQTTAQTTNSLVVNTGGTVTTAGNFTLANTTNAQINTATTNSLTVNGGTFSNSGGVLYIGNTNLANTFTQTNSVTVAGGTLNQAGAAVSLGASGSVATNYTNSLNISSGAMNIGTSASGQALQVGTAQNTASSVSNTVNLSGGKLVVSGQISALGGTGQVNTFNWTGGQLTAGTVTATSATWAAAGGGGIAGSILNNTGGTFAPGDIGTGGKTTVTGGYTQGANGILAIDLGSATIATAFQSGVAFYDTIAMTGSLSLDGKLNVSAINSYTPSGTFNIITGAASNTGTFTNVNAVTNRVNLVTTTGTLATGSMVFTRGATSTLTSYSAAHDLVWAGDGVTNAWDTTTSNWDAGGGLTAAYADADYVTFGDTGSKSPAVSLNSTLSPTGVYFANTSGTYTIGGSGRISGAATVTVQGAGGTVSLNTANDYTGATSVTAGTLKLGNATALGTTAAGTSVTSGAVLDLNGQAVGAEALAINGTGISSGGALINSSGTAASLSGLVTFSSGTSIGGVGNLTLSGGIAATASTNNLIKVGAGTVTLSASAGANRSTVNATTQIDAGVLRIQNASALATGTTAVTTIDGGVLELNGGITLDQPISLNNGGTVRSDGTNSSNGKITISTAVAANSVTLSTVGSGDVFTVGNGANDITGGNGTDDTINIAGSGTVVLAAASDYIGNWSFNAGTAQLGSATALGATAASTITLNGGALNGRLASSTVFTANPISVTANSSLNADRSSNGGGLKYTFGTLSIGANTLNVTSTAAITGGTGEVIVGATTLTGNATFNITNGATANTLLTVGAIIDNANQLTLTGSGNFAQSAAWATGTAGSLRLGVSGGTSYSGTALLNRANTFTGGTVVNSGVVQVGIATTWTNSTTVTSGAFGTGNLTLNSGATIGATTGYSVGAPTIHLGGDINMGSASFTGRLTWSGTWDLGGASRTIALGKSSGATPYASGNEVMMFETGTNGATSIVQNAGFGGALVFASASVATAAQPSVIATSSTTSFASNTGLTLGDGVALKSRTGNFFGTGTNAPALTLNADAGKGGGVLQMGDGTSVMRSAEVYSLSGGGTVSASNTSTAGNTGTLLINNGNGADFSGSITETGFGKIAVTKTGNGAQTFSGTNTYTGATTISGGTLIMGDAAADTFGTSSVTVAATATLGGSGTINPTGVSGISIASTGKLAPGVSDSIGALTIDLGSTTGGLAMASGSIFDWQLDGSGGTPDQVNFWNYNSGDLALNSNAINLKLTGTEAAGTYTATLFKFYSDGGTNLVASGLTSGLSIGTLVGSFSGTPTFDYGTTGEIRLSYSVVPEPTSALAGLLIAAGLLRRRRSA
jgi:autotransporter-associated beta strand protein